MVDRLWLVAVASAALAAVGSVTPWVSVPRLDATASGTDGDSDGIVILVLAALAGLSLLLLPRRRVVPAACGLLALGVATYDVVQILQVGNPLVDVDVGWGLALVVVSSVALVVSSCLASPMRLPGRIALSPTRAVAPGAAPPRSAEPIVPRPPTAPTLAESSRTPGPRPPADETAPVRGPGSGSAPTVAPGPQAAPAGGPLPPPRAAPRAPSPRPAATPELPDVVEPIWDD